ncbi:hypothetical protein [Streptomyces salinarius]|uniref:hypothetical protein n=1 Tax=Streptomyces salinarius TaxID=2762598 RepID=UPI0028525671|nr:hypothetical protein [Streptomyces salinarius]
MAQSTDPRPAVGQGVTGEHASRAAVVLAGVAGELAATDPTVPVDPTDFPILVGVHAARTGVTGGQTVSRLALRTVGAIPVGVSREVFAVQVARGAQALGYDWTADDNRRVIPTIPAPRPEQRAGVSR